MTSKRKLNDDDSARIKCQTRGRGEGCERQATVCHEVHWNTGNTKGVSFFYHCDEHDNNTRGD